MFKNMYLSSILESFLKQACTVTVLAVPESPQKSTGFFKFIICYYIHEYLTVSTVGTRIEANLLSDGGKIVNFIGFV